MRRKRARAQEETALDLTPMLDVVFIMLIFFIVTASFVKESGIDVSRPDTPDVPKKSKSSILIAISDKGEVWLQRRRIDLRAVRVNMERLHAEKPQASVVIQADEDAQTGVMVSVMDQVRQAGVYAISVAAEPQ